MKNNKKKGFTLVEMLAVVVILALLIGIAIPIVNTIIKTVRLNSVKSSYDTLATQIRSDILLSTTAYTRCATDTDCRAKYTYDNLSLTVVDGSSYCTTSNAEHKVTLVSDSTLTNLSSKCPVSGACGADNKTITICIDTDGKVTQK